MIRSTKSSCKWCKPRLSLMRGEKMGIPPHIHGNINACSHTSQEHEDRRHAKTVRVSDIVRYSHTGKYCQEDHIVAAILDHHGEGRKYE